MSPSLTALLVVLAAFQLLLMAPGVVAQSTNPKCSVSYDWALNSRGQNPCVVASYLQGVCAGEDFNLDGLPAGGEYLGPSLADVNDCYCSTVVYSLTSACGDCQGARFTSWTEWRMNCSTVFLSNFSGNIPEGTSVPSWAYLDVISSNSYEPLLAQQYAGTNPPESTKTAAPSSTLSHPTSTSNPHDSSPSNVGAITGGVIGGIVFLATVAAFITWLIMRRRRMKVAPSTEYKSIYGTKAPPGHALHPSASYPYEKSPTAMEPHELTNYGDIPYYSP